MRIGTGRQESVGERGGTERTRIGMAGAARLATWEGEIIYISWVCVGVRRVLQGEVGEADRRRYVRNVSARTTSGTSRTGD